MRAWRFTCTKCDEVDEFETDDLEVEYVRALAWCQEHGKGAWLTPVGVAANEATDEGRSDG